MTYDIKTVTIGDEFKICPDCGYPDGFHSMLKNINGTLYWLFICPDCHAVFDPNLTVPGSPETFMR